MRILCATVNVVLLNDLNQFYVGQIIFKLSCTRILTLWILTNLANVNSSCLSSGCVAVIVYFQICKPDFNYLALIGLIIFKILYKLHLETFQFIFVY